VIAVPVGVSISCTVIEVEFNVAVTITVRCAWIGEVKILKVTVVELVGTVTGFCGWTDGSLLAMNTCCPGE